MGTQTIRLRHRLWLMLVLLALAVTGGPALAQSQDLSYPDKLFGGRYAFTVKSDEVMVRLAAPGGAKATRSDAENLAAGQDLTIRRDAGLEPHGFVVYGTAGKSATAVAAGLAADPAVARAYPALVNEDGSTRYFLPDQAVVQFAPGLSDQAMLDLIARLGSEVAIDHWTPGFYTVTVPAGVDVFDQVRAFIDLPEVQFAELSTVSFDDALFVPNDPLYGTQWGLNNTGPGFYVADADADVQQAWDLEQGDPNVIIAVVDTGVDWDHPDLQPNILQNLGEDADNDGQTMIFNGANWVVDPGDQNGIDDDGNGRIDDFFGWDFASNDNNPTPNTAQLSHGHGTSCAGIAAGVGNNAQGISGVAPGCRIMPLRVNLSSGMNQNRADAINYAVGEASNYEAMILSCSWRVSSGATIAVQNAVNNARANEVLPVFASGNSNGAINFPANLPAAMAIGATSPCDERKNPASCDGEANWGSCFGAGLSVGAPGVLMQTTDVIGGGYTGGAYVSNFNGTSSATPFAAGIAGLVQSKALELFGAGIPADEVQQIIEDSAEQVGGYAYPGGISAELGHGRVNAFEALNRLILGPVVEILPPPVDLSLSIDRSFSMVGEPILAAENAAAQVVRLLDVGDRIAVTSYSGGDDPGGLPDWPAWTDFATTTINNETDKDNAIAAIETGGDVYNLTAIGAGLKKARQELYGAMPAQYPQSVILLSDGINTYGPDPQTVLPLPPPAPSVYTIGFGSFADEATLEGIAMATGGQYYFAGGTGAKTMGGTLPIIQTYQLSLMQATERENLGWVRGQIRDQGEDRHFFFVDSSCDQILVGLLWGHLDPEAFDLLLQDPAGNVYDPSSPEWVGDATVCAYRLNHPEPGEWLALVRRVGAGEGSGNYHLNLAASSRVQSQLTLFPHGFGLPLGIQLRLFQLGQEGVIPLTGADVPCTVTYPNGEYTELLLNDDGQDGDETAGDGVYFATLQNTTDSGSYTVETTAYGQTLQGDPFTRYDLASAVLLRDQELDPIVVDLPTLTGLPATTVEAPVMISPLLDPYEATNFELGFAFDPEVVRFQGLGDPAGTLTENWSVQAEQQSDGVIIIIGEGEPLQGSGQLLRAKFELVGELGSMTPIAIELLNLKDAAGNELPAIGHDGAAAVQSAIPDRVEIPYPLPEGWSLRSLPLVLEENEPFQQQVPGAVSVLGWVAEDYQSTESPEPGQGVWVEFEAGGTPPSLVGEPLGAYTRILPAGWSLLGGLFDQPAVPMTDPELPQILFDFDPSTGYRPATQILPGEGAWFHAAEPFTLTVVAAENKRARGDAADKLLSQAVLTATGDAVPGVPSTNQVVIGGGAAVASTLPYPPFPPVYSTLLVLVDLGGGDPLYSDLRSDEAGEYWFITVRPGGNVGGSGTELSWSPDALRNIADVPWILFEGHGVGGPVVIDDMREQSSLSVPGPSTREFTIFAEGATAVGDAPPTAFALAGNHPNPFNPMTTIRYEVPREGRVRLEIFDLRGRRVTTLLDRVVAAGRHDVVWDGRDQDGATVPSGVYFSRLVAEGGVRGTDRMTLLK